MANVIDFPLPESRLLKIFIKPSLELCVQQAGHHLVEDAQRAFPVVFALDPVLFQHHAALCGWVVDKAANSRGQSGTVRLWGLSSGRH